MVKAWWEATSAVRASAKSTIDQAIVMGQAADRLGLAFFGGYSAALRVIDRTLGNDTLAALCATEAGGGHPRAIETTLEGERLTGAKQFVTGGTLAGRLLVVAKGGEAGGRPQLRVARVDASAPGVTIAALPALPFVPEVPHASVTFEDVKVDSVLEGDGYDEVLKPFRTIEDLHVFAAIVSCLLANGRSLAEPVVERLEAVLCALSALASRPPRDARAHLALAGVLQLARETLDQLALDAFSPDFRERFMRDRPLLDVAGKVREQRRRKAWESLRPSPERD